MHDHPLMTMLQDRYEPFNRLAMIQVQPRPNPNKPLTPFSISDILNGRVGHRTGTRTADQALLLRQAPLRHPSESRLFRMHPLRVRTPVVPSPDVRRFLRPWDDVASPSSSTSEDNEEEIDIEDEKPPQGNSGVSPLDALFQMTSKTFDGRSQDGSLQGDGSRRDQLSLFSKSQPSKKRRKSRTAFTNQQIYELEKRFLYQKYLTPADRDEIAQTLGLSNAQVITWFQNRRAKLKRDLEELKADVTAAKVLSPEGADEETDIMERVKELDTLPLLNKHGLKQNGKKSPAMTKADSAMMEKSGDVTQIEKDTDICSAQVHGDRVVPQVMAHAQTTDTCMSSLSSPDSTTQIKDAVYDRHKSDSPMETGDRDIDEDNNDIIDVQ